MAVLQKCPNHLVASAITVVVLFHVVCECPQHLVKAMIALPTLLFLCPDLVVYIVCILASIVVAGRGKAAMMPSKCSDCHICIDDGTSDKTKCTHKWYGGSFDPGRSSVCCNCNKNSDAIEIDDYDRWACHQCKMRQKEEPPAELGTNDVNLSEVLGVQTELMYRKELIIRSKTTQHLPEWLGKLSRLEILRVRCPHLCEMPASLECLTALKTLDLNFNADLKELPAALSALPNLQRIDVSACHSLHTPPTHVVKMGTAAVMQFLGDLAKGNAACHLAKVVLCGNQKTGKSSLADSLIHGRPLTRADNDRTVGIEVRRWRVGGCSQLVVNIYDAAGQRVYRATHGFFMSAGALFLHVVRSDMEEDDAVAALLEWVEAVQHEAPGAVMGIVWTHADCFAADATASTKQFQVLERVCVEINRQVQAVGDAMWRLEQNIEKDFSSLQSVLSRNWTRVRELRDMSLAILDQLAMTVCQSHTEQEQNVSAFEDMQNENHLFGKVLGDIELQVASRLVQQSAARIQTSTSDKLASVLSQLQAQHREMQRLEGHLAALQPGERGAPLFAQLQKLRNQRTQCPRILFSHSVSCRSGKGLYELRQTLAALMEDRRLFPHVGMKVPLNYSMLERLAQEGRALSSGSVDHADVTAEADRAEWESAVTSHVAQQASLELRAMCGQAYVSLGALKEAAVRVGMDEDEVCSALRFLHATGSVLHYGVDMRRSSPELQNIVFMQPQFIIDAIKYVIREPSAKDINDQLRTMDANIRKISNVYRKDLDEFLHCGQLTNSLLTQLWTQGGIEKQHHSGLVDLLKTFNLMRFLWGTSSRETFLVPAMLPRQALPAIYMRPQWWNPSEANDSAFLHFERPARMRIVYEVLGGRLPMSFMCELQVRLATRTTNGKHFSPDVAVVDSVAGSVLSQTYECGGSQQVKEVVIVSQHARGLQLEHVADEEDLFTGGEDASEKVTLSDSIRVMAWVELTDTPQGATDWRLLRMLATEIESTALLYPALNLVKMAVYVDVHGRLAKPLEITHHLQAEDFISFKFAGDREETVKVQYVLPSAKFVSRLEVKKQQIGDMHGHTSQRACMPLGTCAGAQGFAGDCGSVLDLGITGLFNDAQLEHVCETVCSHFGIARLSDMLHIEDRDIAKLDLKLVDSRKLEVLVRKVRGDAQARQVKGKVPLPHAELPAVMDAAVPRFALTIGNNEYAHFGQLTNCLQDARMMTKELQQLNFNVATLLDYSKADMEVALDTFLASLPASSPCVALFHFSGHGLEIDGENFLVPIDANGDGSKEEVKNKCISVQALLSKISCKFGGSILVIFLLDCCRENPTKSTKFKGSFAKLDVSSHLMRIFMAYATAPGKLAAAKHSQCPNLSPFTYALIDCLKNRAIATKVFRYVKKCM